MKAVVIVRGTLKDLPDAQLREAHDQLLGELRGPGGELGNTGYRAFRNSANPNELMVIDTWTDAAGAEALMSDPELPLRLGRFFDGTPAVTIWTDSGWDGYDP